MSARRGHGKGDQLKIYTSVLMGLSAVGTVIEATFVSRILKYLGVRLALFILPLIAFGGYASIGLLGGLLVLR